MDTPKNYSISQCVRGALSKAEAAEYIGVSARYLDHLIADGELQKVKLGRKTVIRIMDLDRLLEQNLQDHTTQNRSDSGA